MVRPRFALFTFFLVTACGSGGGDADDGSSPDGGGAGAGSDAGPDSGGPSAPDVVVEGPVTDGAPLTTMGTSFDVTEVGYELSEYFISGTAQSYRTVSGGESDWEVEPATTADYKTRIVVQRPADPSRFSGTVFVEWLNVSGGLDAPPDWIFAHVELIRRGHAWVGVSAQSVGIEGGGGIIPGIDLALKNTDPVRYGSLNHPGDNFSYDIYSQAGAVVRFPTDPDPLGGLVPEHVIAIGESQSAFRMTTYVNAIHPVAKVFDGFMIHSRGGAATQVYQAPDAGMVPQDGDAATEFARGSVTIRDDIDVPVFTFQAEADLFLLGSLGARQPDSANFRLWEVAGTAHADTYTVIVGGSDKGDDPSVANIVETSEPIPGIANCPVLINSGPHHFVLKAAVHALNEWVVDGVAPPSAPFLEVEGDPPAYVLDEHGNVRGGVRSPALDAPTAVLSGLGQDPSDLLCALFGSTVPFDDAKLAQLYPTHADYVSAVSDAADEAVAGGFLLEEDAALINAAAEASSIGN